MEQWYLYKKKADFNQIGEKFNIDPVIARLIRNRDVVGDEQIQQYLYGELSDISDPFLMKGVKEGVEILKQKVQEGKTIRIISDYDVDGVVSNYILWKAIHDLGGKIDFQIPDRMKDGYGINENIIEKAVEDQIDTILTCDNGIAAADAVAYGKEHGLTMIITDHHDVPFDTDEAGVRKEVLPPADVVINPKQEACNYPYPLLCGAGVAFQFMRAFYQAMEEDESQLEELLSMLAIATVCDVVDLTGENRIFVKEGLRRIKDTQNIGLKALLNEHDLMDKQIQSYALGFIVGPCINASGRLESAEKALNLFLEEDEDKESLLEAVKNELEDMRAYVEVGEGTIEESQTEDVDWVNNWKKYFHQFYVDDILIIPSWEEVKPEDEGKMIVHIDPGTAFGTGMHETTQLCIRQLRKYVTEDTRILDVGCGSGILGMLALMFGAKYSVGTDLDPCAIDATYENMEVNGISKDKYEVMIGNIIDDKAVQDKVGYGCYDIVVANILADVLVPLTPVIVNQLKDGGIYVTSGVIEDKEETVKAAVEAAGLTVLEVHHQGEWVSVTARKETKA